MSDAHAGHGDHDHPDFLQHHFDSPLQQFDSTKLGMWLFLATEILLFGGLFVAYSIYRGNHPEIFQYAHYYLDTTWGAINTVVLLISSFTMAWGVRAAQLGQTKLLTILLAATIACGGGFMVIKYVEYQSKFDHGTLWASRYAPHGSHDEHGAAGAHDEEDGEHHADDADHGEIDGGTPAHPSDSASDLVAPAPPAPSFEVEKTTIALASAEPRGRAVVEHVDDHAKSGKHEPPAGMPEPDKVQIFFSIYFMMTGLHGLHVLIGMLAIGWCLFRNLKGHFSPAYFTPVDLVGLYWHLVDLIWIFLFPMLYLIH